MAQSSRTFRIFISSTFRDMQVERNALQRRVFPHLRDLCREHGARFQPIDLRWGVSQDAGRDQRTMRICFEEIDRCRNVSPDLNFLILLGDTYGSYPVPEMIPAAEYDQVHALMDASGRGLLETWYAKDFNEGTQDGSFAYILKPRIGALATYTVWRDAVERPLHDAFVRAFAQAGARSPLGEAEQHKYTASATHQEIYHGLLGQPGDSSHALCLLRTISGEPTGESAATFVEADHDERNKAVEDRRGRLAELRDQIEGRFGSASIYRYDAPWDGDAEWHESAGGVHRGAPAVDLDAFCARAEEMLAARLVAAMNRQTQEDAADPEVTAQEKFGQERRQFFVGRGIPLEEVARFLRGTGSSTGSSTAGKTLLVTGASGSGKSALIARAVEQARAAHAGGVIVERYCGATPSTSGLNLLLSGMAREISREYNRGEEAIPADDNGLIQDFPNRLAFATAQRPLLLFVDALDQLGEKPQSLAWLPQPLPPFVRVVLSVPQQREEFASLRARRPEPQVVTLGPLSTQERGDALDELLASVGRKLQPEQRMAVLDACGKEGLPLYLRLLFQQARQWPSFRTVDKIGPLDPTIPGILRALFAQLSADASHGPALVAHSLGYLAAAKNGLSEDELLDVLVRDEQVRADLRRLSPSSPEIDAELPLPVVLWSRLYFDLAPYLSERAADGASLLTFYHRQLRDVVTGTYLGGDEKLARHRQLARYFQRQALKSGDTANLRKLSEQPYQQTEGEQWDEVYATLTDTVFLEAKASTEAVAGQTLMGNARIRHFGVYRLQDDYTRAIPALREHASRQGGAPDSNRQPQVDDLAALGQAVARESQRIADRPDLIWQTLDDSLGSSPEGIRVREALGRVPSEPEKYQLRVRKRANDAQLVLHQSYGREFKFMKVGACDFSRDGRLIASCALGTLFVWDAVTGEPVIELRESSVDISSGTREIIVPEFCAFRTNAATGKPVLLALGPGYLETETSSGRAGSVLGRVAGAATWDVASWKQLSTTVTSPVEEHEYVRAYAVTQDGTIIVAGINARLVVWDLRHSTEAASYTSEQVGNIQACAFNDDETLLVTADDFGVALWDTSTWHVMRRMDQWPHSDVSRCTFIPLSTKVVTAHQDATLHIWDAASGEWLRMTLQHIPHYSAFQTGVLACAASPDGQLIASGGADHTVKLWDAHTGERLATFAGHFGIVRSCAFSPDSTRLASGADDGNLMIWDVAARPSDMSDGAEHYQDIKDCAFSPDGDFFVTGSADKAVKVWDAENGQLRHTLLGHRSEISSCLVTQDSRFIISGAENEIVRVWDARTGEGLVKERPAGRTNRGNHVACAVSPDNTFAVVGIGSELLRIDPPWWSFSKPVGWHSRAIITCAVSPDSSYVATGGEDAAIRIWDTKDWSLRQTLQAHDDTVRFCVFSPDSAFMVSAESEWRHWDERVRRPPAICVWDTATWQSRLKIAGPLQHITGIAITPDGRDIVCADHSGGITFFDVRDGQEKANFKAPTRLTCMALHPWKPFAVLGGPGGVRLSVDLLGIQYGPVVVTARRIGDQLVVRCSICRSMHVLTAAQLGNLFECPAAECHRLLRLTSFTLAAAKSMVADAPATTETSELENSEDRGERRRGCWPFRKRR